MKDQKPVNLVNIAMALTSLFLLANSAHADRAKAFKMRFSAGFIQNITQDQVVMGMPTGATEPFGLIIGTSVGSLGRAETMAVTKSGPPISADPCPAGLIKIADIVSNNLLWRFNDLSMVYGDGKGVVCLDPLAPMEPPVAEIDGTWLGGTGRFEGVAGDFSIRFTFFEVISPETQFIAETGVIKGRLVWD